MESPHPPRGFTLIELLVVLAIILIVTAITITSQASFDKTITLANTAYDVALTIRSAESFGLGSRSGALGVGTNVGYGVHFSRATPNTFTLFADTDPPPTNLGSQCHPNQLKDANAPNALSGDCIYTSGNGKDIKINDYTLGNGMTISNFCAHLQSGSFSWWFCSNTGTINTLDITFARPNPDVFFSVNSLFNFFSSFFKSACIAVSSPDKSSSRYVSVKKSGEINANATSCP